MTAIQHITPRGITLILSCAEWEANEPGELEDEIASYTAIVLNGTRAEITDYRIDRPCYGGVSATLMLNRPLGIKGSAEISYKNLLR